MGSGGSAATDHSPESRRNGRPRSRINRECFNRPILSIPAGLFVYLLLDRNVGQAPPIVALVAADPPFFDPFLLHVRLPTLGTDEHALHEMHHALFFHARLLLCVKACRANT